MLISYMKKIFLIFLAIAILSFLGLPVPEWLENIVNLIASFFTGIINFVLKILSLIKMLL